MVKSLFKIAGFVLLLASLAACGPASTQQPEQTSAGQAQPVSQTFDSRPLQVGYIPQGAYNPVFVAKEKGYFAEQGLNVELQSFRTGSEAIAPLSLGQLDAMGGEVGPAFFNAINQGLDLKGTMSLNQTDKDHNAAPLIIRKDLYDSGQIKTLVDLKGKKIAVNNERGLMEYRLAILLNRAGLTVDDVELVVIAFPDMLQALANKAVDAAMLSHPLAAAALSPGANGEPPSAVLLPETQVNIPFVQGGIFYYGKTFLDPNNHDTAVKFTVAILKAVRDLNGEGWRQNDQIIQAIVKYTKVSEATARGGVAFLFNPNGEIQLESFEDIQNYVLERGYVDYQEPLTLDQMIDDSFRKEAIQILGEYDK